MDIQQLREIADTLEAIKKDLVNFNADTVDDPVRNRVDVLLDEAATHLDSAITYVLNTILTLEVNNK